MQRKKIKTRKEKVIGKQSWFSRTLDKLEDKFPQLVETIRYLYGIK